VYNHRIKTPSLQNKRYCGTLKNGKISYMNLQIDHDKPQQRFQPTDRAISIDEVNTQEDSNHINIYTDGSISEQGVGAIIAIKSRKNNRGTNVQN